MNRLLLALLVSVVWVANAQADETQAQEVDVRTLHQKNFLGQRPYAQVPATSQQPQANTGEMATTSAKPAKGYDKHQQLRLNFLGKRPYMADIHTD